MKPYMSLFDTCVFAFDGKNSILEDKDIGICANIASMLTPPTTVAAMKGFQGCPYTNTAFDFDLWLDGEKVKCSSWKWLTNAIVRQGSAEKFAVETVTAVVPGIRAVVQKVTVKNRTEKALTMPLSVAYRGVTRREENWKFKIPDPDKDCRDNYVDCGNPYMLSSVVAGAAYRLTTSLPGMKQFRRAYLWENAITVPAAGELSFYFSAHMGEERATLHEATAALGNHEYMLERSFDYLSTEAQRIHDNLPRLKTDDPELTNLYYRSLVTYILSRWENPDLCAVPYYSTGSVTGGCMCSYLWDYCGGLMLHPVYDPEGNKEQLRAYLRNDLTQSYALNPVTSGAVGPWYPINQEKIILMVYHHVRATGQTEFLFEQVGDKTVLEWMRFHAYVCDDLEKEADLYDYGEKGNSHLELHHNGNGPYNGVMPDLNARRWLNYMRVYELTVLAGQPDENLPKRAASLAQKLKSLWNDKEKWYDFVDAEGNRDTRYTVQMFKFLNSGVLGEKEREGLVSHLNEQEFLSKFGLHSLSKQDPQYDQDDIDNGGGGICTHFTMQVCAQLYETGYDELATDILKRVYWWGTRMPYMGDSCAANHIANRETTPLQGDISSVSAAQMIFFYIFGIQPGFDGSIRICPVKNRPVQNMQIENARLQGKTFAVKVTGDTFTVEYNGKQLQAVIGKTVTI